MFGGKWTRYEEKAGCGVWYPKKVFFFFSVKMFSDSNAENRQTVHIKSDWKREKKTSHNECQTSQRKLLDQESQVVFYQDAEIQTTK